MKQDKVTRLIAGALLSSDLSYPQLLELSDRLRFDRQWLEQLSATVGELAEVARRGGRRSVSRQVTPAASGRETYVEQIVDMFNRKRMRRSRALDLLAEISATQGNQWMPNGDWTLRQNVDSLIAGLSAQESRTVMKQVSEILGISSDAYLRELL